MILLHTIFAFHVPAQDSETATPGSAEKHSVDEDKTSPGEEEYVEPLTAEDDSWMKKNCIVPEFVILDVMPCMLNR